MVPFTTTVKEPEWVRASRRSHSVIKSCTRFLHFKFWLFWGIFHERGLRESGTCFPLLSLEISQGNPVSWNTPQESGKLPVDYELKFNFEQQKGIDQY